MTNSLIFCSRWSVESPESLQLEAAAKEKAEIENSLHQPPDLRTGETVSIPEVLIAGRQGRDSQLPWAIQRTSHHMVPEQTSEAQTRHGGAEERRGKC